MRFAKNRPLAIGVADVFMNEAIAPRSVAISAIGKR